MKIHLVGVIHTDPNSELLVRAVINSIQPDIVFLEVGKYRLNILQSNSKIEKITNSMRGRIFKLRPRGRIIHQFMGIRQLINSFKEGTVIGSVDMIPAINAAEKIGARIEPIDMEQHKIMNKLGKSMISIQSLLNFNLRERIEFIESFDLQDSTETLQGLSELEYSMSQIIPQRYNVLVTERNKLMVDNIQQVMNNNDVGVTVVGALHLPGMIKELQNRGFDVEIHL